MLLTSELQAAHCNLATACLGDARWSTAARFYQAACWGTIPECAALQAASCPKECMHSWWAKAMKESFVSENFSQSHSSIFVNDTTWSGTPTTFYSQHSCSHPTHTHTPVESHVVELDQQCACASAELQLKLVLWF